MDVVIKNVHEKKWKILKSEAASKGKKMGEFLGILVDTYVEQGKNIEESWNHILNDEPTLSDKEAELLENVTKMSRKKFTLRV